MTPAAGRSAVVSGASRGIGLAVARLLTAQGMRVAMLARSTSELEARAAELGPLAVPITCDVADADAVRAAADRVVADFGGAPHALVNNAGLFRISTIELTNPADFRAAIDVNLVAPFMLTQAFVGAMRARGTGHIVTIGSIADRNIFPENGAYSASKYGVRALHEVLRAELRGSGVRASLISPSAVDTPLWNEIDPDTRPGFTPRRMMLSPDAVASAVAYVLNQPDDVNVDELRLSRS